jgi:hypothetical protein
MGHAAWELERKQPPFQLSLSQLSGAATEPQHFRTHLTRVKFFGCDYFSNSYSSVKRTSLVSITPFAMAAAQQAVSFNEIIQTSKKRGVLYLQPSSERTSGLHPFSSA